MTDEMLKQGRANAAEAGVEKVDFVKGYLEDMPLPDKGPGRSCCNQTARLLADM